MKRLLMVSALFLLAGCKDEPVPPKEEFDIKSCAYAKTGKTGERTWTECRLVGKNSCGNQIKHVVPTEEFTITCQRSTWVDQKK